MLRVVAIALLSVACKSETSEVTVTVENKPVSAPKRSVKDILEKSLRKKLEVYKFDTFTCPDAADDATSVTCTVKAANGVAMTLVATPSARKDDGSWKGWGWEPTVAQRVITAEELADKLREGVTAAVKKAHSKATSELACGTSPVLFVDHKATCKLAIKQPDKVVQIVIDDSKGELDWSADAF